MGFPAQYGRGKLASAPSLSNDTLEILRLEERIRNALILRESHFREFKSGYHGAAGSKRRRPVSHIARDIGETLVAFANADGGELLIGVEDDGVVTGVPHDQSGLEVLRRAPLAHVHKDTPLASPTVESIQVDDLTVFYFAVQKSTRHVHQTIDGRCLQRRDRGNIPVSMEKVRFERKEQLSREYDRAFVDGAGVLHLNADLLQRVSESITPGMSGEKCLQYLSLAEYGPEGLRLRKAAVLLFATDVRRWHPRSEIRVLRVAGTELRTGRDYNVVQDDAVNGNILELLTRGWETLRPHLVRRRFEGETGTFQGQVAYPEDAVREAFYNAVGHRDYSSEGRNIECYLYNDRLEMRSPGAVLSTINLSDLKRPTGVHDSRNANVARVLREGHVPSSGVRVRHPVDVV